LTEEARLTLIYALARQKAASPRPWINEGLAHFAQVSDIEQQHNRNAAVEYLKAHVSLLADAEAHLNQRDLGSAASSRSLVNTADDLYLQTKAMWVWWMLRDMIGETQLNMILSSYHASEDNDPSYMPHLIAAQTQRDLAWFFDDWVYHDRGLPDFKVESAFAASTPSKSFLLTITLDNLGTAGAEVPVTIKFAGGEVTKRIEVRAKSKATFRVETPASPQEIRINDGSVPESDMTNNTFKVEAPQK
jgi:aminopeptidase N